MIDLVERLRQRAGNERNLRWGGPEELMVIEAADEIGRLRAFVHWALSDGSWQGRSIDGGEIQDKAIELGLVVKTKYDNAIHGESAEAEDGDDWYMLAWSKP
jgi:hypothetical protein